VSLYLLLHPLHVLCRRNAAAPPGLLPAPASPIRRGICTSASLLCARRPPLNEGRTARQSSREPGTLHCSDSADQRCCSHGAGIVREYLYSISNMTTPYNVPVSTIVAKISALRVAASGLSASRRNDFGVVVNGTSKLVCLLGPPSSFWNCLQKRCAEMS